ncbi:MAG: hypothetical protein JNL80_16515 [Phycisphaerae bacterium]|jgi:hypothetical protein|nr:hypothetical protein [Phycisphaerae bacterium]
MMFSRIGWARLAWASWALVPVVGVAYHFGPGQLASQRDKASRLQVEAIEAERIADEAQAKAYQSHLDAMELRRAAFVTQSAEDESKVLAAMKAEDAAYASAAAAWKSAADRIEAVRSVFGDTDTPDSKQLRLAHGRALVRAGEIWSGIESLEGLLTDVESTDASGGDTAVADRVRLEDKAREELATAYYYGARLLRLSGLPAQEWMVESGKSRQQFRFLAEHARAEADTSADNYQRNLELVLNLEQSSLAELQAKPIPRESPSKCQGNRPCSNCNKKGQKPPQQKKDARGAGGAGAVPPGW